MPATRKTQRNNHSRSSRQNSLRHNSSRSKRHLRVSYSEANHVRNLLLSEDVQMLHKRDIQTLLKILDDVYPARQSQRRRQSVWKPLLIGVMIGLLLILGVMAL